MPDFGTSVDMLLVSTYMEIKYARNPRLIVYLVFLYECGQ